MADGGPGDAELAGEFVLAEEDSARIAPVESRSFTYRYALAAADLGGPLVCD